MNTQEKKKAPIVIVQSMLRYNRKKVIKILSVYEIESIARRSCQGCKGHNKINENVHFLFNELTC